VHTEPLVDRRRRATALITLAAISIAAAGFAFLYSAQSSKPGPAAASDNPLLVTRDFVTYSFTSPTEGWAMDLASGTALTASRLTIFRTVDRGRRWEKQLSLSDQFFGYGALPLQAVDPAYCFMLLRGPTTELLFRTADSGAHWDQVAVPNRNVVVVDFIDRDYGWLLTSGNDLYVSRDAGSSWQPRPAPPADASQLRLRRPTEAWMTGFDSGPPHVYSSGDIGESWQRHDLPSPPGGSWDPGSYFQPTVELLPQAGVVASVVPQGGAPPFIATSFDGGVTWRQVLLPGGAVAYEDSFHWWAMGDRSLYKSSDAGQTWTEVTRALPDWMYRPQLYILDSKHAWVSVSVPASLSSPGGSGLAFTDDGGLHWTRAQVPHES
jgi:photosystem II stability/assembly factor-like uncharacterized protein